MRDAVEMLDVVAVAKEVAAEVPVQPCLGRRKASEVGACKDLEGHIFTIGSGNKGEDGDMLCTSMEKMAPYIGTNLCKPNFWSGEIYLI